MTDEHILIDEKTIKPGKAYYIDKRGFLYLKIVNQKRCKDFKTEQLKIYINLATTIAKENHIPILIDSRDVTGVISSSTFSLLAKDSKLKACFSKIAFVANSLPIKLMIHNYIRIYKPYIPTKVFKTIEQGIDYLLYKPQDLTWK